jgi:hypothetical protein
MIMIVVAIAIVLSACSPVSDAIERSRSRKETATNRATWEAAKISHYRMVVDCYCGDISKYMPWTVEVKDGELVSVIDVEGDPELRLDEAKRYTIDGLFDQIEWAYVHRAPSVKVTYDATYGYPVDTTINPTSEPCCQEFTITVREFEILP